MSNISFGKAMHEWLCKVFNTDPSKPNIDRVALKFAEEAGEVSGEVIRLAENRSTSEDVGLEIGDTLVCLHQLSYLINISLDDCLAMTLNKLDSRHSEEHGNAPRPRECDHQFVLGEDSCIMCGKKYDFVEESSSMPVYPGIPEMTVEEARNLLKKMSGEDRPWCQCGEHRGWPCHNVPA